MPDLQRYAEIAHSYIVELKYLPKEKFDAQSAEQWEEAVAQIHGYAAVRKSVYYAKARNLLHRNTVLRLGDGSYGRSLTYKFLL